MCIIPKVIILRVKPSYSPQIPPQLAKELLVHLDLPVVELCVRASNELATAEARKTTGGSVVILLRFLEHVQCLVFGRANPLVQQLTGGDGTGDGMYGVGDFLVGPEVLEFDEDGFFEDYYAGEGGGGRKLLGFSVFRVNF